MDRHVERGCGLVGDQQARARAQTHRDHRPLAHASGEHEGELADAPGCVGNAGLAQQVDCGHDRLAGVDMAVDAQGFADLPPDPVDGVERRHGVLKDHRDLCPAHRLHLVLREGGQDAALERDLPLHDASAPREQAHDRKRGHRLARSGLADDAQRLTGVDGERDAVHCPDRAVLHGEVGVDVIDLQQVGEAHQERSLGSRASRSESPSRLKL